MKPNLLSQSLIVAMLSFSVAQVDAETSADRGTKFEEYSKPSGFSLRRAYG
jgi:hypothetical protein